MKTPGNVNDLREAEARQRLVDVAILYKILSIINQTNDKPFEG